MSQYQHHLQWELMMATGLEVLGYLASFFIGLSFCMTDMKYLRWLNLTGAFLFAIYGYYKQAYPVLLLNGLVTLINMYHLWRMNVAHTSEA